MENPIKMDDLGVPLFLETPIFVNAISDFYPRRGSLPDRATAPTAFLQQGMLGRLRTVFVWP